MFLPETHQVKMNRGLLGSTVTSALGALLFETPSRSMPVQKCLRSGAAHAALQKDGGCLAQIGQNQRVGIPMMSISHSDLMPIRAERSDAGLSQCETVIDMSQDFCRFSWF